MLNDRRQRAIIDRGTLLFNTAARALVIVKNEGFAGLVSRLKDLFKRNVFQSHMYVLSLNRNPVWASRLEDRRHLRPRKWLEDLELGQVVIQDEQALDYLTIIDPWKISRKETMKKLKEGWQCFCLKHMGQIISIAWAKLDGKVEEAFLKRVFYLDDEEIYFYRGFCIPSYRGKGVIPWMAKLVYEYIEKYHGKKRHMAIVRISNKRMLRTIGKVGWSIVGRVGFIEIFGVRFNYLLGREAFRKTKKGFTLTVNRRSE